MTDTGRLCGEADKSVDKLVEEIRKLKMDLEIFKHSSVTTKKKFKFLKKDYIVQLRLCYEELRKYQAFMNQIQENKMRYMLVCPQCKTSQNYVGDHPTSNEPCHLKFNSSMSHKNTLYNVDPRKERIYFSEKLCRQSTMKLAGKEDMASKWNNQEHHTNERAFRYLSDKRKNIEDDQKYVSNLLNNPKFKRLFSPNDQRVELKSKFYEEDLIGDVFF